VYVNFVDGIFIFCFVISLVEIALTIFIAIFFFIYRGKTMLKLKHVQLSFMMFCTFIVNNIGIFLLFGKVNTTFRCNISLWLIAMATSMQMIILGVKELFILYVVMKGNKLLKVTITPIRLMLICLLVLIVVIFILIIFTAVDPYFPVQTLIGTQIIYQCQNNFRLTTIILYCIIFFEGLISFIIGLNSQFTIKNIKTNDSSASVVLRRASEGRNVFITLNTSLVIYIFCGLILYFVQLDFKTSNVIFIISLQFINLFIMLFFYYPVVYKLRKEETSKSSEQLNTKNLSSGFKKLINEILSM